MGKTEDFSMHVRLPGCVRSTFCATRISQEDEYRPWLHKSIVNVTYVTDTFEAAVRTDLFGVCYQCLRALRATLRNKKLHSRHLAKMQLEALEKL